MIAVNRQAALRKLVAGAFLLLAGLFLPLSAAQGQSGPPQYVRDAVDKTIAMLDSSDGNAVEHYVDEVMIGVTPDQRASIIAKLTSIRSVIGGVTDGVEVEGLPGGVILILGGSTGTHRVNVSITPEGVTSIDLASSEDEPMKPASDRDGRTEQHIQALERLHRMDWDAFVSGHLSERYRVNTTAEELGRLRQQLVNAAANAGGAGLDVQGDVYRLTLGGPDGRWAISFTVEDEPPFAIDSIEIEDANAKLSLPVITRDNLDEVLGMAEQAGLDGVVYVRIGGDEISRTALGLADRNLGLPMTTTKIFGVGSQPIDFTVAMAYIASAQGHLSLDDPISEYVGEVPQDKAGMTVRNLLENMSGLPDFIDNEQDWDPDLAWISRDEFVRRILAAPLRFEPGARRGHSHAGFSFLAAIVEIATGKPYFEYLKEQILEPAGMTETGMYGSALGLAVEDFAVGGGPSTIGLPNIPPNWGPTSWLVKGSGGMYSSLKDILKFTRFVQTSQSIPDAVRVAFSGEIVNFNGSRRGFEMFEFRSGTDTQILIFSNSAIGSKTYRDLAQRLEQFGSTETNRQ
jgi:hypothetical protein